MESLHLTIRGRVQGVFFRAHAQEVARKLRLAGWVQNRPDGDVEVMAEGARPELDKFLEWCRRGPPQATGDGVRVEWGKADGQFKNFEIRY